MRIQTPGFALVAVLVSASLVSAAAFAGGRGGSCGAGRGHDGGIERHIDRLDLDEKTRAEAFAILDAARPTQRELRREMRDARQELHARIQQDPVDEAAVYAQQDVLSALKNESRRLNLATMLQVRALLTPEQREQLRPRHHSPPGE